MVDLLRSGAGLAALLVFVAVAVGSVGMVLALEWLDARQRQRTIISELKRITDRPLGEIAGVLRTGADAPRWMKALEARFPRLGDLSLILYQAGSDWTPGTFVLVVVGMASIFGFIVTVISRSLLPGMVAAALGAYLPYFYINRKRKRRMGAFEEGLPETIDLLGRAIRAGHPLSAGLKMVADEMHDPIAPEFRRSFEEQRFGVPFEDAMLGMADRVGIIDVRILVTAILIQREVGGNLAEVLDNLASVIRARFTIRRQLRTFTAQGRMTGYILALMPLALASIIYMLNRDYMSLLWTHPIGRLMLFMAIIMQFIGFLWIRKIIDIDI